jgi:CBS domain-containing protein
MGRTQDFDDLEAEMANLVRDVMTSDPRTLDGDASATEAARLMQQYDIGDVIVLDGSSIRGIVTDRDIVVRAVAQGREPALVRLASICSDDVTSVKPDDSIDTAVALMRERALRRLPVVEDGQPVGIVTMGDVALLREPQSALAEISGAPPNR